MVGLAQARRLPAAGFTSGGGTGPGLKRDVSMLAPQSGLAFGREQLQRLDQFWAGLVREDDVVK
jgi:hypothetical protein